MMIRRIGGLVASADAGDPRAPARGISHLRRLIALSLAGGMLMSLFGRTARADAARRDAADIKATGLTPRYPEAAVCPPITSLFGSWDDVDGSRRDEPHSGIDAGRLGDIVISPASGTITSVWKADWGWGQEGALLIAHTRDELGLSDGPAYYFSEFDHLRFRDIKGLREGMRVNRGQRLATVSRPGGDRRYLPEVHWEVWAVEDADAMRWATNRHGGAYWTNQSASLVDPLYMMSLDRGARADLSVDLPLFDPKTDYGRFRGFTYPLKCTGCERPACPRIDSND